MHRNILIISIFIFSIAIAPGASAQDTNKPARPNVPGTLLVDVGVNLLQNNNVEDLETGTWGSKTVNIYYLYDIQLGNSKFFILPGFGLGLDKYKFDENVMPEVPLDNPDTTVLTDLSTMFGSNAGINKSKLATNYVDIPIEFRFYSDPDNQSRSFKAGIGGKVGILYSAHTKVNYELNDHENKLKHKQDLNLSRIRYGLSARLGFSSFNLYAYYGLNELFEDGKGPGATKASTLSVGLTINAF
jgi:hypothetical protein